MGFFDFFPYTNFHNVNLDWVLQRVKEWGELVEANDTAFHNLEEANASFKLYVENYLADLDVQAQIDDKLDRMFESGELTDYLQPYVSDTVTDWLEENITEPTGVIIDSSLTVSGACADAKATGDRIKTFMFSEDAKRILIECLKNLSWYKDGLAKNYTNRLSVALGLKESERRAELPKEYEQVSYIYGIRGQYINTGIKSRIPFEFNGFIERGTGNVCMGGYDNTVPNSRFFPFGYKFLNNNTECYASCRYGIDNIINPDTQTSDTYLFNTQVALEFDVMYHVISGIAQNDTVANTYIEIDGNRTEVSRAIPDLNNDFYLFNVPSGFTGSRFRLGQFRLLSGEIILADYIPCYRISDGVIGFYDVVSQTLKTNNGTGTFETGEVIA